MPRPTFADPRTDFAFKRLFGSEEREDILVAFLNDILGLGEPDRITQVKLRPPEQRAAVAKPKLSIAGVTCTDARGVTYVIEMQGRQVEGFEKRVVYNAAAAYVSQNPRGGIYPKLNDVVGITVCDFELGPDSDDGAPGRASAPSAPFPMVSRWCMTEQHTGVQEPGPIRFVFLELPKYDTTRPPQAAVEKWAYFFRKAGNLTAVPEALSEHPFVDALEAVRTARFTAAEWDAYVLSEMAIQNDRGALSVVEKHGTALGREEGLRTGLSALCDVLGIELTDARKREIEKLDAAGLDALIKQIRERKRWS